MKTCPKCNELFANDSGLCPQDGAELKMVTDPKVGSTIAQRYRLISRLGGGTTADVYLARHVMISRLSAIKILRSEYSASSEHRDRFLREARAVNRINHENIIEITDLGEQGDCVYLVMEYVPGDSLQRLLTEHGKLDWERSLLIGTQLISALARAHQMGVIHRDLKPDNVLLLTSGGTEVAKLSDFGIAKITDAPPLTTVSQVFGTPGYIAPENLMASGADEKSDLYSFGVMLYQCLTGKLPYRTSPDIPLMIQVLKHDPVPLQEHHVSVPMDLEKLLYSLLEKQPAKRPRDAFLVLDRMVALLLSAGYEFAGPLPLTRTQRPSQNPSLMRGSRHRQTKSSVISVPFADLYPMCKQGMERMEQAVQEGKSLSPSSDWALQQAKIVIRDVGMASQAVEVDQVKIAALELHGREFRMDIGRALDVLAHDRSLIQQQIEALRLARGVMPNEIVATSSRNPASMVSMHEEERLRAAEDDLSFQIAMLRSQLKNKNEKLEHDLDETRSELEGRVAALRRLAAEAWNLVEEVGTALGVTAEAPASETYLKLHLQVARLCPKSEFSQPA
jgi:eukaryotic-like serine/threonine-protein kinase